MNKRITKKKGRRNKEKKNERKEGRSIREEMKEGKIIYKTGWMD